jgi:MoxR-like ATPase
MISSTIERIVEAISRYIVGMEDVITLMLTAMLTEGPHPHRGTSWGQVKHI